MSLRKALEAIEVGVHGRRLWFPRSVSQLYAPTDWQIAQVATGQLELHRGHSVETGCHCAVCLADWFARNGLKMIPEDTR